MFVIHCQNDVDIQAEIKLELTDLKQTERAVPHHVFEHDIFRNWSCDRDLSQALYMMIISTHQRTLDILTSAFQ